MAITCRKCGAMVTHAEDGQFLCQSCGVSSTAIAGTIQSFKDKMKGQTSFDPSVYGPEPVHTILKTEVISYEKFKDQKKILDYPIKLVSNETAMKIVGLPIPDQPPVTPKTTLSKPKTDSKRKENPGRKVILD